MPNIPAFTSTFSVGAAHEFGGTGTGRITRQLGTGSTGASLVPTIFFAKGLGDSPVGYFRPLAIQGFTTYQLSDGPARADNFIAGLAVEYSIPYLDSKVKAFDLPELVRGLTPLVEMEVVTPTRNRGNTPTVAIIAPGLAYSGQGWEFAIEARVPATHATGTGVGILAQFTLALDYLFPETLGKPLFGH